MVTKTYVINYAMIWNTNVSKEMPNGELFNYEESHFTVIILLSTIINVDMTKLIAKHNNVLFYYTELQLFIIFESNI